MSHRKGNKSVLFEEVIQQALDAIRSGKVRSAYAAKKKFGVGRALLCRRLNGSQQSRAQARESQQLLTIPEGDFLVAWCRQLTVTRYPARHNVLKEMAEGIRTQRLRGVNTEDETLVTHPPNRTPMDYSIPGSASLVRNSHSPNSTDLV